MKPFPQELTNIIVFEFGYVTSHCCPTSTKKLLDVLHRPYTSLTVCDLAICHRVIAFGLIILAVWYYSNIHK